MKKIRKYRSHRGVTKALWRQPLTWLVIVVMLLAGTGLTLWLTQAKPMKTKVQLANASLTSADPVFTASQKPKLALTLPKHHRSLSELLVPRALADTASAPQVDVTYKDGDAYVPVQTTPTDSGYDITISPNQTVRPGVYRVTVKGITEDGQPYVEKTSFAWGVLAVNTDQATYTPGQTVNLSMAVLDAKGHTKCNMALDLIVTGPNGQQTNVPSIPNKDCEGDSYISAPDYTATYTSTSQTGIYKVQFGLRGSTYHIDSSFSVANSSVFVIQRTGASRFNPNYEYGMHLHVTTNQAFKGQVTEVLPDHRFIVGDKGGATVTNQGNNVTLTWNVNWQAGRAYDLAFTYHPPRQAPSFFTMSPVKLVASDGTTIFQEGKGWQLAGDSAITHVYDNVVDSGGGTPPAGITLTHTTTAGNLLVVIWGCACVTSNGRTMTISDSASQTWVTPGSSPSTNPPNQAAAGGVVSSEFIYDYIANSASVTTVTTTEGGTPVKASGFNLSEWSGIDVTNFAILGNSAQTAAPGNGTTPVTGPSVSLTTCDVPTTDELMAQGEWFCPSADAYLVISSLFAGKNTYGAPTDGFTAMNQINANGVNNNMAVAYNIISTTGTASTSWTETFNSTNDGASGIMAFGQDSYAGSNREQAMYK